MKNLVFFAGVVFIVSVGVARVAHAQGMQMPNPREMAGIPLPVGDVATGSVVVRVIRGSLSNPIADQPVELQEAGKSRTVTSNAEGRAAFTGLTPGSRVKAIASVGEERLVSQEFAVPESGGIRVMLVATDPDAEGKAADDRRLAEGPAQPGMVVLDDQSRFVFEMADDGLSVFNILQILNTARTPVQPPHAIVFDLPAGARGAAVLQGSSPQASVVGTTVVVSGPFAPGQTLVQFAYSMPYSAGDLTVEQRLPVALARLTVLAQKVGNMQLTSAQMSEQREMTAEGQTYIVGQGPPRNAGDAVAFSFANLPHEPTWPRSVTLTLAGVILVVGAWGTVRVKRVADTVGKRCSQLEARRTHLFTELTSLEQQHREGRVAPHTYAVRRRELMSALERVYTEIDQEAA